MFIVCDNVLRWLSQAYHNPPLLSWFGTDNERCTDRVKHQIEPYVRYYAKQILPAEKKKEI